MTTVQDTGRYTRVAIALHWAIAGLILFNLTVGFFMEGLQPGMKGIVVGLHVSSGITVLVLTAMRLGWRLTHEPPPFPSAMAPWEKAAAHAAHGFIYLLMFTMPLTGWGIVSAHPPRAAGAALIWGVLRLPQIQPISRLATPAQKSFHDSIVLVHSIGGWIFVALLVLHVGAALKHQFYDRHAELARMGLGQQSG